MWKWCLPDRGPQVCVGPLWPWRCCLRSIFPGGGAGGGEKQSRTTTTCAAADGVLLCAAQVVLCSYITERGWPPVSWGAEPRPWRVSPLSPPPRRRPLLPSAPSRTRWCVSESSTRLSFFPCVVACPTYVTSRVCEFRLGCGMPNICDVMRRDDRARAQTGSLFLSLRVCVCLRAAYARMRACDTCKRGMQQQEYSQLAYSALTTARQSMCSRTCTHMSGVLSLGAGHGMLTVRGGCMMAP